MNLLLGIYAIGILISMIAYFGHHTHDIHMSKTELVVYTIIVSVFWPITLFYMIVKNK